MRPYPPLGTASVHQRGTSHLTAERAAFRQAGLAARGGSQDLGARAAHNDRLGVAKHSGQSKAPRALNVLEVRAGLLNEQLELVRPGLLLGAGVEEVDGQSLRETSQ